MNDLDMTDVRYALRQLQETYGQRTKPTISEVYDRIQRAIDALQQITDRDDAELAALEVPTLEEIDLEMVKQ